MIFSVWYLIRLLRRIASFLWGLHSFPLARIIFVPLPRLSSAAHTLPTRFSLHINIQNDFISREHTYKFNAEAMSFQLKLSFHFIFLLPSFDNNFNFEVSCFSHTDCLCHADVSLMKSLSYTGFIGFILRFHGHEIIQLHWLLLSFRFSDDSHTAQRPASWGSRATLVASRIREFFVSPHRLW